jgi:hypothetical protein
MDEGNRIDDIHFYQNRHSTPGNSIMELDTEGQNAEVRFLSSQPDSSRPKSRIARLQGGYPKNPSKHHG